MDPVLLKPSDGTKMCTKKPSCCIIKRLLETADMQNTTLDKAKFQIR